MNGGPKSQPSCFSCGVFLKGGKEQGSVEYKRENNGTTIYYISLCRDCLDNPEKIDISKIEKDLRKYWDKKDIKLVIEALEEFKKGKMRKGKWTDGEIKYNK